MNNIVPLIVAVIVAFVLGVIIQHSSERSNSNIDYCKPTKVSESSDNITLWKVSHRCKEVGENDVYFSTQGTQTSHKENVVKNSHTIADSVPNTIKGGKND